MTVFGHAVSFLQEARSVLFAGSTQWPFVGRRKRDCASKVSDAVAQTTTFEVGHCIRYFVMDFFFSSHFAIHFSGSSSNAALQPEQQTQ